MHFFNWSKSTRISIMLVIDIIFFFIELISGLMVHSLALTADAFHMLNDIISLAVGLWAVRISKRQSTDKYSYGWVRAEILGGFFNAVFLIALCISIIIESITRFVDPPQIENPQLILIVGCVGLMSNLVGFAVLSGDHGHSHGHSHGAGDHGHEHVHDHDQDHVRTAEEGRSLLGNTDPADDDGPAMDVLPQVALARAGADSSSPDTVRRIQFDNSENGQASERHDRSASRSSAARGRVRRRASSLKHSRLQSIDDNSFHPASFRQNIIDQSRSNLEETDESSTEGEATANESTPLFQNGTRPATKYNDDHSHASHKARARSWSRRDSGVHKEHHHAKPKKPSKKGHGGHSHSHTDMGMHAMILHVIGDALGNIGVIVTALIIWLTDWPGKLYADPAVSLFITAIILKTAIPLTQASAQVLLQATPDEIDIQEVKEDIENLEGVISCHHVHVWRLSDNQIVASMHVQVAFPVTEEGGEKYMALAKSARKCLHAYGIHSATIQPEFCLDQECSHVGLNTTLDGSASPRCGNGNGPTCLLGCTDDCEQQGCCPLPSQNGEGSLRSGHSSHDVGQS